MDESKRLGWREHHREKARKWRLDHPEQDREQGRKDIARLKRDVIGHYSPNLRCVCCGYADIRALCIDHIEGGGNAHRNAVSRGLGGQHFYRWLKQNEYPPGFQVLCMNCHTLKGNERREPPP
jgi:hypothetical protein